MTPAALLQGRDLVSDPSIWNMVLTGSWFAKTILLILLGFSLVSWAIILKKLVLFRSLRGKRDQFFHAFERRSSLAEAYQAALAIPPNPLTEVFKAGTRELKHLSQRPGGGNPAGPAEDLFGTQPGASAAVSSAAPAPRGSMAITILEKESIHMALEREASQQVEHLEEGLPFLATTGSVAPFFGLLGTVWGIMDAFLNIGLRGSGNINVVAPGVAEALITTIGGLAVAIPAVIAYNHFVSQIKEVGNELRHFSSELINVIVRERRA
ncbi:MAG TPA: MotA/TolQ/ExbB proton channel family protein [Gemmatimonadota bacterium]|nr:MotA/TolQ/ExbB proton channel family protein [Gemmatimonadota bacterium]